MGRRWTRCDTTRVSLAVAPQRLITAKSDYCGVRDPERGPAGSFLYEDVPHIILESIAKERRVTPSRPNTRRRFMRRWQTSTSY